MPRQRPNNPRQPPCLRKPEILNEPNAALGHKPAGGEVKTLEGLNYKASIV